MGFFGNFMEKMAGNPAQSRENRQATEKALNEATSQRAYPRVEDPGALAEAAAVDAKNTEEAVAAMRQELEKHGQVAESDAELRKASIEKSKE